VTNTQRWYKIAAAFGTPVEKRTLEQAITARAGLCWAWFKCGGDMELYDSEAMRELTDDVTGFLLPYPNSPDGQMVRAMFAALMGAMTQRERNAIGRP